MKKYRAIGWKFRLLSHIILIVLALAALLPFCLLIIASFTDEQVLLREGYSFFPSKLSIEAYVYLFRNNVSTIFRSYGITLFTTFVGTALSILITPLLAYPLSRSDYPRRKQVSFYVFFTMLFNGGMVPSYIMWTQIFGIKNTEAALIFPSLVMNGFVIMLLRSNFKSNIHPTLIEAAKIDGAMELTIYARIVMPLSKPILATVGLMIGLGYWNDWTNGLYYISDKKLYSIQQLLNNMIQNIRALNSFSETASAATTMPSAAIRMALAVVGVLPILVLYPFFQNFYIKGIALGGVKE